MVNFEQETLILGQPRQEALPSSSGSQLVDAREELTMLFHLIGTEQL